MRLLSKSHVVPTVPKIAWTRPPCLPHTTAQSRAHAVRPYHQIGIAALVGNLPVPRQLGCVGVTPIGGRVGADDGWVPSAEMTIRAQASASESASWWTSGIER